MGLHIDALHNGDSEYVTAVSEIKEVIGKRGREPLHWYDFVFDNFLSVGRKTNRLIRLTHQFTDKVFMTVVIIMLHRSNTPETVYLLFFIAPKQFHIISIGLPKHILAFDDRP